MINKKKFLIIIFSLVALELSLQIIYKLINGDFLSRRVNLPLFEKSDFSCWKLKSNLNTTHKTNEFNYNIITDNNSYRSIDTLKNKNLKDSRQRKVMFLGAAFAYGQGNSYSDTYAYLISEYLKTKGIAKSINAAAPAQLPNRQLCWFIQEGHKYKPDIIIHTLIGNTKLFIPKNINNMDNLCRDLSQCKIHGYKVNKNGYLVSNENILINYKYYLKNSALIFYSWYFYVKTKSKFFKEEKKIINFKDLNHKNIYSFPMYENYLKVIKKYSKNTKVIFMLLPNSYNIHLSDKPRWSHQSINFDEEIIENNYLVKKIRKQYNFIDLHSTFLEKGKTERIYHYLDASLNIYGNKLTFGKFKEYCEDTKCYDNN